MKVIEDHTNGFNPIKKDNSIIKFIEIIRQLTDFNLKDSKTYGLSYLDDIAFEWIDQAIHGLKTISR